MKLVTFCPAAPPRLGLLTDGDRVIDLAAAVDGLRLRGAHVDAEPFGDLRRFLAAGETAREVAHEAAVLVADRAGAGEVPVGRWGEPLVHDLAAVRLAPPILDPQKILAAGLNYRDHAAEQGAELPRRPMLFSKHAHTLIGSGAAIVPPPGAEQVDYEAELAVVIGRRGRRIAEERALEHVAGYACFNDVTARDFQFGDRQWFRGKNCDTFGPMGPFLATADEVGDPGELDIRLWVNDTCMQDSNTRELVFGVADLVSFASSFCTLEVGDVIATGTPGGVGFARDPQVFLRPGDVVRVEIDRLGRLENTVMAEDAREV